jgi:hypothetical protein
MNTDGVFFRGSLPNQNGYGGGLPEWVIPDANRQVRVDNVFGLNPEFSYSQK